MHMVYKYYSTARDICKKKFTCFQMPLSCAIDRQQNMPSFVIMPGYATYYKSWCDMSAQHSSEI